MSNSSNQPASALPHETLHRLHDGELDPDVRAATEASLDDGDRARLAVIGEIGQTLRHAVAGEVRARPAPSMDALWGAIEKQIQPAKVLPLHTRVTRALMRHPVWLSTSMAAAAALAVMVAISQPGAAPSNGCDIDSIDVTGASVTVMHVDTVHAPGSTTVVWLQED